MAHRQGEDQKRGRRRVTDEELLLVLDARLGGKSHRLIAVDLYGKRKVAKEWRTDSPIRARVRWRVAKSLWLMNGGYLKLLAEA